MAELRERSGHWGAALRGYWDPGSSFWFLALLRLVTRQAGLTTKHPC
jgi:hypothetical protein